MDAITTKCANLKLSERERSEVDPTIPRVDQGLVLVVKFSTKWRVNLEAIGRALWSVWRTKRDFEVSDMGENRVLFSFRQRKIWIGFFCKGHGPLISTLSCCIS